MKEHILIVDDEEHIRRMMRLTLETAGYEVGEARDGLEGVKLYEEEGGWDAVVLDQRMPGIDGLETLTRIRQRDPDARVVMATAYASIELAVEAMKLGATDFVRKPLTPDSLRNSIRAMLAKRAPGPGAQPVQAAKRRPSIIETVTMNGFTILDHENRSEPVDQRVFTVIDPEGARIEVAVQIESEVIGYVERITRRRLSPQSSFWTSQARRLLADYLWSRGEIPRTLSVSEISRDEVPIAEKWEED
jgi:DNA-binding response OmpR family regulator